MARTRECHTSILCGPTDERYGEQEPATKCAIVASGTDRCKYGCHDGKANPICNEDNACDGLGTTHPREDTLARGGIREAGRARSNGWVVASGSSETLE